MEFSHPFVFIVQPLKNVYANNTGISANVWAGKQKNKNKFQNFLHGDSKNPDKLLNQEAPLQKN